MTTNLAETTKVDLAAEVDRLQAQYNELGIDAHKLEIELAGAQTEIAKLQSEITDLAARPCLACATLPPPADVATLGALLDRSLLLLDAAIRHRRMARDTDPIARMEADEMWPHYLREVDKYRAAVARKGA